MLPEFVLHLCRKSSAVSFVLIVVILQLWLLTATMSAWLGGDESIVWPAAAASAACLALNLGLYRYLVRLERTRGVRL